jgi:hypothetical protein
MKINNQGSEQNQQQQYHMAHQTTQGLAYCVVLDKISM